MFVKVVQKWNAFKADWSEYQRLRRIAARAWRKLECVRKKITVSYSTDDTKKVTSCIRREFVFVPYIGGQDELNSIRRDVMPCDSYCKYFKGGEESEKVASCAQTDCPCYAGNCEYVAAAKELAAARENRSTFWNRAKVR